MPGGIADQAMTVKQLSSYGYWRCYIRGGLDGEKERFDDCVDSYGHEAQGYGGNIIQVIEYEEKFVG